MSEAIEIKAYKCPACGVAYLSKNTAENCPCCRKRYCEDCGKELTHEWFFSFCDDCLKKREYEKCRKITIEEYEKEYPKNMVVVGDDNYYSDVYAALEDSDGNPPCFVFGTESKKIEVDIDSAIEDAIEDAYEDAEFSNVEELRDFVHRWNEKNHLTAYYKADIIIEIPEDVRKEYTFME